MKRTAMIAALGALALAGCGQVNVTSNDADTQNLIDGAGEAASDLLNGAGNLAADAGNELGEAARAAGNGLDSIGDGNEAETETDANKAN